jgi:hypothetical protein
MSLRFPGSLSESATASLQRRCEAGAGGAVQVRVAGHGTTELSSLGLASVRVEGGGAPGWSPGAQGWSPGAYVVGLAALERRGEWQVGLACVPRSSSSTGAGAPGILRAEVLVLSQRSTVPGRGAESWVVPLARADVTERFPFGAPCELVVVKRLSGFDAMATGPWLRDHLVRLLDAAEETAASKL